MTGAVIFLGPTLTAAEAMRELDCLTLPPARQGDVFRAVQLHRPRVIGLIDGAFLDVPAVWHREILWALSEGVHVFGAASMGALRAAELDGLGMRGVGRVYEAYRAGRWPGFDEPFEDDDEVAVVHAPAGAGGGALSDAMVDVRATLLAAEAAGVIDRAGRDDLSAAIKRLHFADRSFERLAEVAATVLTGAGAIRFGDWLPANHVRQKRLDSLALLRAIASFLAASPAPFRPDFRFEQPLIWERFVASAEGGTAPDEDVAAVLDELHLDPAAWLEASRAALGRLGIAPLPTERVDDAAVRRQLDAVRRARRLWRRADLEAWLAANALDPGGFEGLLRREAALAEAAKDRPPGFVAALLDHLRVSGAFARLRQQAVVKQAALSADPNAARCPTGPAHDVALAWYFETKLGLSHAPALEAFLREAGWQDAAGFAMTVWREYLFATQAAAPAPGAKADENAR